jgi:hypothetical protein
VHHSARQCPKGRGQPVVFAQLRGLSLKVPSCNWVGHLEHTWPALGHSHRPSLGWSWLSLRGEEGLAPDVGVASGSPRPWAASHWSLLSCNQPWSTDTEVWQVTGVLGWSPVQGHYSSPPKGSFGPHCSGQKQIQIGQVIVLRPHSREEALGTEPFGRQWEVVTGDSLL